MPNLLDIHNIDKDKTYFYIGEISEYAGIPTSTIRFWEKEFPVISPQRNSTGNRIYTYQQFCEIVKIFNLVKVKKFSLLGARKELENPDLITDFRKKKMVLTKLNEIKIKLNKITEN